MSFQLFLCLNSKAKQSITLKYKAFQIHHTPLEKMGPQFFVIVSKTFKVPPSSLTFQKGYRYFPVRTPPLPSVNFVTIVFAEIRIGHKGEERRRDEITKRSKRLVCSLFVVTGDLWIIIFTCTWRRIAPVLLLWYFCWYWWTQVRTRDLRREVRKRDEWRELTNRMWIQCDCSS